MSVANYLKILMSKLFKNVLCINKQESSPKNRESSMRIFIIPIKNSHINALDKEPTNEVKYEPDGIPCDLRTILPSGSMILVWMKFHLTHFMTNYIRLVAAGPISRTP